MYEKTGAVQKPRLFSYTGSKQQAQQRNGDDAEERGEQGTVGSQFLAVVVNLRQVQDNTRARRGGEDQDTARIRMLPRNTGSSGKGSVSA